MTSDVKSPYHQENTTLDIKCWYRSYMILW